MLDGVSLDYLRAFVAAAREGSFSAAGRRLGRAQSVVSQTVANLEGQLGVVLFDRTGRRPQLSRRGRALLPDAEAIVVAADRLRAKARRLAEGLEEELSVVIDVMLPQERLIAAIGSFSAAFPDIPIRLHIEALGAVAELVLSGQCRIGVTGTLPIIPEGLTAERLFGVEMVTVAAPNTPIAQHDGPVPLGLARSQVQIVLTDRSALTQGRDFGVQSEKTWRIADLGAKLALLRAGLGWGHMPLAMVRDDIATGYLRRVDIEGPGPGILPMQAIFPSDRLPGPAGRHFLDDLTRPASKVSRDPGRGTNHQVLNNAAERPAILSQSPCQEMGGCGRPKRSSA
jgi:DNA-binding transcriptional LysR family regulator